MNQEQKRFNEMNARTTANITLPPRTLAMILVGEAIWLGGIAYLAMHGIITGLLLFLLVVIGIAAPGIILSRNKNLPPTK